MGLTGEDGGCLLQHGLKHKEVQRDKPVAMPDYVLDIDSFRMDVPASEVASVLDATHRQAFSMFRWALGPKAIGLLENQPTVT